MSAYTQFGYPYATAASQLLVPGQTSTAGGATTSCCETGRVVATDPVTGAAICSCQYDSSRLSALNSYPRLSTGSTLHYSAAYAGGDPQSPYPSIGVDSGYFGSLGGAYGLKETGAADMSVYGGITSTPGYGYNPYDPSLYGYGAPYDLAARRKNATREATGTLKAWMNEHKKNPYPTKGEKIMLAIITKMTLTQISTWFANARRRLKKENKMTWEPKNKTDSDDDDTKADTKQENDTDKEDNEKDNAQNASGSEAFSPGASSEVKAEALSPSSQWKDKASLLDCGDALKPKIWSLADTAVCKTPPAGAAWSGETRFPCGDTTGTTFPLPPTIGPGQIPRFSHLSQTKSMSQSHSQSHSQSQSHAQSQSHTQAQSLAQSQAIPQAQAQSRSQPQASPTDVHYQQGAPASSYRGAGGGGVSYGGMPTYGDTGTVTPPHTPPALNKSNMAKTAPNAAIHGYTGTYPGVLSALERRTETYPVQQLYRHQQQAQQLQQQAQQMQQHVADMSQHAARQHMPPDVNAYASAYKENAVASSSTEYISPMSGH